MKYRIKHAGSYYIAQRKRWFGWQTLHYTAYWYMCEDVFTPEPRMFMSVPEAEDAIKTAIIATGISTAHTRVVKMLPPWSVTTMEAQEKTK